MIFLHIIAHIALNCCVIFSEYACKPVAKSGPVALNVVVRVAQKWPCGTEGVKIGLYIVEIYIKCLLYKTTGSRTLVIDFFPNCFQIMVLRPN